MIVYFPSAEDILRHTNWLKHLQTTYLKNGQLTEMLTLTLTQVLEEGSTSRKKKASMLMLSFEKWKKDFEVSK